MKELAVRLMELNRAIEELKDDLRDRREQVKELEGRREVLWSELLEMLAQ